MIIKGPKVPSKFNLLDFNKKRIDKGIDEDVFMKESNLISPIPLSSLKKYFL